MPQGELNFVSDWQSAAVLLEQLWTASSRRGHAATASRCGELRARAATADHAAAAADAAPGMPGRSRAIAEECADSEPIRAGAAA